MCVCPQTDLFHLAKKEKKYQRHNSPTNAPTTIVFNLKA